MGFFDSSTTTTNTATPWAPAAGGMQDALNSITGQQWSGYNGPWAAGSNPMLDASMGQGFGFGQSALQAGQGYMNQGMQGYADKLSQMGNTGPRQFQMDQGTFNQQMQNMMPGMQGAAAMQGLMGSRALQSNLGQLTAAAGQAGGSLGSNPMSKLANSAASATALQNEGTQRNIQNMYMNAAGSANQAAMGAGQQNLRSGQAFDQGQLAGYGKLGAAGQSMAGMGLGNMYNAGNMQHKLDQAQVQGGLANYQNNMFGQQQFNTGRFNPAYNAANAFKTTSTTQTHNPSGMSKLGQVAGLAGSIYGGMGGMGGLSSIFGGGGGGMGLSAGNQVAGAMMQANPNYDYFGGFGS